MIAYTITHTGGAYLRETMRTATSETVEDVLRAAAAYKGVHDITIERVDGGDVYACPVGETAPILVARQVQS